jgi:hypothetical protein
MLLILVSVVLLSVFLLSVPVLFYYRFLSSFFSVLLSSVFIGFRLFFCNQSWSPFSCCHFCCHRFPSLLSMPVSILLPSVVVYVILLSVPVSIFVVSILVSVVLLSVLLLPVSVYVLLLAVLVSVRLFTIIVSVLPSVFGRRLRSCTFGTCFLLRFWSFIVSTVAVILCICLLSVL